MTYDADKIKAVFAGELSRLRTEFSEAQADLAMQKLSAAIGALQKAGLPFEITIEPWASQQAFRLVDWFGKGSLVNASGLIEFNEKPLLFAIGRNTEEEPVKLYVSVDNIDYQGAKEEVRSRRYDIVNNEDEYEEFQRQMIEYAAADALCHENDPAGVFNREAQGELPKRKLPGAPLKIKPLGGAKT